MDVHKGYTLGKLVVISEVYKRKRDTSSRTDSCVLLECVCGVVLELTTDSLRKRKYLMCNKCRKMVLAEMQLPKVSGTRLYNIWSKMKGSIRNPVGKSKCYVGLAYYEEWEKFAPFCAWALRNGYKDTLSIDRIDNSKGYYPENCRWVTPLVQSQNRRKPSNNTSGYVGVYKNKCRAPGGPVYKNTYKTPYYWIVQYNGGKWSHSGYATALEANMARIDFIKNNFDGLVLNISY